MFANIVRVFFHPSVKNPMMTLVMAQLIGSELSGSSYVSENQIVVFLEVLTH